MGISSDQQFAPQQPTDLTFAKLSSPNIKLPHIHNQQKMNVLATYPVKPPIVQQAEALSYEKSQIVLPNQLAVTAEQNTMTNLFIPSSTHLPSTPLTMNTSYQGSGTHSVEPFAESSIGQMKSYGNVTPSDCMARNNLYPVSTGVAIMDASVPATAPTGGKVKSL